MQTLLSTACLSIYLHEEPAPVLELSWCCYAPSQQFREGVTQALALATTHQAQGWISDDRQLGAVRPRDLDWGMENALHSLTALGLQRFALLESEDALNRRIIDGVYQQVESAFPFILRRFTDLTDALAWALGIGSPA